eukprot:4912996-Prymnesium_polylepis.3
MGVGVGRPISCCDSAMRRSVPVCEIVADRAPDSSTATACHASDCGAGLLPTPAAPVSAAADSTVPMSNHEAVGRGASRNDPTETQQVVYRLAPDACLRA